MLDLRSDTVTRPTQAMRRAMALAEVGDDVLDGDPTVRLLERTVAERLGKDRALFFPSGTMANQAALWLLGERGTEVVVDAESHIVHYEFAGAASLCGVQLRLVQSRGLVMDAAELHAALRSHSMHLPAMSLVCVENTHNSAGGVVTPLPALRELQQTARGAGLPVHMDGARLWNASIARDTPLADFAECADSVMVSFSKGLGAPVGACLAGRRDMMDEAVRVRRRFGGAMRQSGILAAGALHGLTHHMARLVEDHRRAAIYAARIDGAGGARVVSPDTNIVMLDLPVGIGAEEMVESAEAEGIRLTVWSPTRIRAVFHLDVDDAMTIRAGDVVARLLEQAARG